jgi:hypothetical protein
MYENTQNSQPWSKDSHGGLLNPQGIVRVQGTVRRYLVLNRKYVLSKLLKTSMYANGSQRLADFVSLGVNILAAIDVIKGYQSTLPIESIGTINTTYMSPCYC